MSSASVQKITLVGCGDTTCSPSTTCLLSPSPCKNCLLTHSDNNNINNRLQTSILLEFGNDNSILVDCGLTFRDSVLKSARQQAFQFPLINGFVATRNAPDSILGSDDIREVTNRGEKISFFAPTNVIASMNRMFPYIMPAQPKTHQDASGSKNENQKFLWTAGLTPHHRPLKHGERYSFPVMVKKQGEETTTAVKEERFVDVIAVGKNEKEARDNCGFAISLEDDGSLIYPNNINCDIKVDHDADDKNHESSNNKKATKKSRVCLYLPFDCFDAADIETTSMNNDQKTSSLSDAAADKNNNHYLTSAPEILKHFEIEVAVLGCPSFSTSSSNLVTEEEVIQLMKKRLSSSSSSSSNNSWKDISMKKIVLCNIPHNVVAENGRKLQTCDEDTTVVVLGIDMMTLFDRSSIKK